MNTYYTDLYEITELQRRIVRFITYWVKTEKTPIPRKEIIEEMLRRKQNERTTGAALDSLIKLGYIRRAVTNANGESGEGSAKTMYVQLRSI